MQKPIQYISVPKGLPTKIMGDNRLFRAICIFYKLKSLYKSGNIRKYRKRYGELSKYVGCCESNLRKYIGILKEEGLVWSINDTLYLKTKNFLKERYNVSKNSYKIDVTELSNLQYILR